MPTRAGAMLALVAERERVARDVHDVLGHSLTAMSIKAELAARLIDVDPERARAELESIQETARQALAEVRATVGGLRAGNLEAELAAAPQVLADAGIETRVLGSVADTDPRHRTLLAWVLREAVTNVVRHARASCVVVELGPRGITVTDDGTGLGPREGRRRRATACAACASGCPTRAAPWSCSTRARAPACRWCCRDPAAAGRRPGAGAGRAGRAARPGDRPHRRGAGRSRRRGARRRPRVRRRGLPARHRDARATGLEVAEQLRGRAARRAVAHRHDVRPAGLRPPGPGRRRGRVRRQGHARARARGRRTPRARRPAGRRPRPGRRVTDGRALAAHRARGRDPAAGARRLTGGRHRPGRAPVAGHRCATTCPRRSARPAPPPGPRRPGSPSHAGWL